jgi:hypothetical protein
MSIDPRSVHVTQQEYVMKVTGLARFAAFVVTTILVVDEPREARAEGACAG